MVKKISLDDIYNVEPDILSRIPNPIYGNVTQRFLSDAEMVDRAFKIIKLIENKSPDLILYSDTGAWPLVYICQTLISEQKAGKKLCGVPWKSIKCPRESAGVYEKVILSILTPDERIKLEQPIIQNAASLNKLFRAKAATSLAGILSSLDNITETHKTFEQILASTEFGQLLLGNVVYLDEYIDSGITLSNTFNVLKCFNTKLKISIVAYHIFAKRDEFDGKSVSSLYASDDGVKAFIPGAYPYENRIDIISKYYVKDDDHLKLITISDILQQYKSVDSDKKLVDEFIGECLDLLKEKELLKAVDSLFNEKVIVASGVVVELELLRYLMYLFERELGSKKVATELLWNLFDMFGPAWSPLPDTYHLDFWQGFDRLGSMIRNMPEFCVLMKKYEKLEKEIIYGVARICEARHRRWRENINSIIKLL